MLHAKDQRSTGDKWNASGGETFGKLIDARRRYGSSLLEKLALAAGLSQTQIGKLRDGEHHFKPEHIQALAHELANFPQTINENQETAPEVEATALPFLTTIFTPSVTALPGAMASSVAVKM